MAKSKKAQKKSSPRITEESLAMPEVQPASVPATEVPRKKETVADLMAELRKEIAEVRKVKEEYVDKVAKVEEKLDEKLFLIRGITEKEEEAHKGKKQLMKEHLDKQPKKSIFIPLDSGEKVGRASKTVTLNGYRYEIPKGIYVEVPEQVAQVAMDSLNQSSVALESATRLDNSDVSKDKLDALS